MTDVREAASLLDTTISAFLGELGVREARKIILKRKKRCPHCGASRAA
jgi:uncharacterized protein (DUF1778 family)